MAVPIPEVNRAAQIPLSLMQREILALEKGDGKKFALDIPAALRLRGSVDIQALEAAVNALIERHEVLRSAIVNRDGQLWQEIRKKTRLPLSQVDLSTMNRAEAEAEVFERIKEMRKTRFDLENDAIVRGALYRLSKDDFILFLNMHRMIGDRRSLRIIESEILNLYDAVLEGKVSSLEPLPVQYADFAAWECGFYRDSMLEKQKAYWLKKLEAAPALDLPLDFMRPRDSRHNAHVISFEIPGEAIRGIRAMSAKEGVSTEEFFLAALGVFFHRYTGQDDICLGWERDGRSCLDMPSPLIGPFSNLIVLRTDLSGTPSFVDLLKNIRALSDEVSKHSDVPFEQIARNLTTGKSGYGLPLIGAIFTYDREGEKKGPNHGLEISLMDAIPWSYGVDVEVGIVEGEDSMIGRIVYNADAFKPDTIDRMKIHFLNLLSDIVQTPKKELGRLDLLDPQEKERTLGQWNETEVEYPRSVLIHSLFEEQAERTPGRVALIQGDETLTYRELNRKANQLAHFLKKKGLKKESLVALCVDQSFDLVIGILGIVKAGGAYVPLDPTYPKDRLAMMLEDCNAPLLLTKRGLLKGLPEVTPEAVFMDEDWKEIEGERDENPANKLSPDSLFYVIYTSGSTGRPKGVAGTYEGMINRLFWMWDTFPFSENEVCCLKTSAGFVDHVAEIFGPLLRGIPLAVLSHEEAADVEKLLDLIIEKQVTRLVVVPSQLQRILGARKNKVYQLAGLKYVFCSGEALPVRLAKQFYQDIRNARLVNIYGATEVSADVAYYEVKRFHVDDVLRYFTRSLELPGSLIEAAQHRYPNPISTEKITEPNVPLQDVARRFTSSRITEWPMTLDQYYKKLHSDVLPYVINTAAPTFIGHMTSALPDFVHDLSKLISQLNQNLVKIETGKSLIFLEREALAILHRCFYELPDEFYESHVQQVNMNLGLVTTGGTSANIIALLTARNLALFGNGTTDSGKSIYALLQEKGYDDMTILGSKLMHYSMRKATSVLGLGLDSIMYVDCDGDGRLDIADLQRKVEECRRRRVLVLAIVGIAGATETGRIEPLAEMGAFANSHGIHFHVDAAWGGTTILSEKHKARLAGIERADSITFCGHKQLYLPQGISVCLFKDPRQAQYAATSAAYQAAPDSYDVGRFTLEGSRSAISLCLHAALRIIGKKGYELLVDSGMEMARFFADLIKATEGFELIGYPDLNIVNYRYIPIEFRGKAARRTLTDEDNRKINRINTRIQESQFYRGKTFVSKTTLSQTKYGNGKEILVLRVVLSNPLTTQADIYAVLEDQLMIVRELFGEVNKISFREKGAPLGRAWQGGVKREPLFIDEHQEAFVPIGKPLSNCMLYILDKYGNPVPIGVPGELCAGGAAVNRGYLNMPALTDKVFVPNPFTGDRRDRLFKTGDRARFLADGNIDYLGRFDDQIKIQGYRVEVGDVESALREIEHVENCAVVAKTDAQGSRFLVAYLVPKKAGMDLSAIPSIIGQKLPPYMVPSAFEIIGAMPLTPSGKTDKKVLAEIEAVHSFSDSRLMES